MKINQDENLIDNDNQRKELKEIINFDDDEIHKTEKEENQKEVNQNILKEKSQENSSEIIENPKNGEEENILNDDKNQSDKETNQSDENTVGKKEIESILLVLNSYWIELLGSISLIITILIYEFLILLGLLMLNPEDTEKKSFTVDNVLNFIINKLGLKWFYFIRLGSHLSVGFFCLTTFTTIMKSAKNIKKFYIVSFIQVFIFYAVTVVVLKVLIDTVLKNFLVKILKDAGLDLDKYEKIKQIINLVIQKLIDFIGGITSTFNTFLEKIVFGTMYIFLFKNPKCCQNKKIIYFRLLALIPLIYIIICLTLRGLSNTNKTTEDGSEKPIIELNVYCLPIILGAKISIYVFFISTLSIIKLLSFKYEIFDEENDIKPKVFTKIGSRIFSIIGIIELILGLFFPSWSKFGIGGSYLLILCAPIMTIYDYKKKYELKFPCCKKGDMTLCFKIVLLVVGWLIVIIMGLAIFGGLLNFYKSYIKKIADFIIEHFSEIVEIIKIFL